jgi:N-acetylmuramoyl-L-alanine amidase
MAAKRFVAGLDGAVTLNKNPLRAAGFKVLSAPDVPSLLLELGYMSSPKDTEAFLSDAWQEKATAALAKSIETYFARKLAGGAQNGLR